MKKKRLFYKCFPWKPDFTVAEEHYMQWKKVIFQGGSIIFSQKILRKPPPSISPVESFVFLLEALTSAEAYEVSSSSPSIPPLITAHLQDRTAPAGPFPFPSSL